MATPLRPGSSSTHTPSYSATEVHAESARTVNCHCGERPELVAHDCAAVHLWPQLQAMSSTSQHDGTSPLHDACIVTCQ